MHPDEVLIDPNHYHWNNNQNQRFINNGQHQVIIEGEVITQNGGGLQVKQQS